MSFPGSGLQAIYRNSLDEVCRFLTMKHGKAYMIWNLSEHTYDYKSFDNRIMDAPFPDHHAPPMDLLFSCLQTLDSWIRSAEDHIAVLHCMGGKGRTGTMIICYLFFSQMKYFPTIDAARQLFARKRSAIEKGIVQPSQIRYVNYFSDILDGTADIVPRAITIESIRMQKFPEKLRAANDRLEIEVYDYTTTESVLPEDRPLWASYWEGEASKYAYDADADIATLRLDLQMSGDILIKGVVERGKKYKAVFLLTFNTSFIDVSGGKKVMRYMRKDLDLAFKDKKLGWDEEFQVDVTVLPAPSFSGVMQQTNTWARMRDVWQAKFPSLVKQRRDPVAISQSAKRAEEIARDSRLAAIAQQRNALPTPGARAVPPALGTPGTASSSMGEVSRNGAGSGGGGGPAINSSAGWVAGETLRRQRAGNAPLITRPVAMTSATSTTAAAAAAVVGAQRSASPTARGPVMRRDTKSHIKLHVTAFGDDNADEATEETFEFDVDNDDATTPRRPVDDVTEIQWMNFAELNEIESQVMQMQQDVENATMDFDRAAVAQGSSARVGTQSPKPVAAVAAAAPQRVMSPALTTTTRVMSPAPSAASRGGLASSSAAVPSVDSIIRDLGAAVGAEDASTARPLAASSDATPSYDSRSSYSPAGYSTGIAPKYRGPAGEDLSTYVWYRPEVNRQMAEEILRDSPIGCFIVRPSSQPACLALSHKDEEYGVGHMLLRYWNQPGRKGYSRESEPETFDSVVDVLHSLPLRFDDEPATTASPPPTAGARTGLTTAVPLPTKAAPLAPGKTVAPVETEPALRDDDAGDDMVDMLRFF